MAAKIDFQLKPIPTDAPAEKTLAYARYLADPDNVAIKVCNNAHDPAPAWENAKQGQVHEFSNKTSASGKWALCARVTITPSAGAPFVYCQGLYVV